MASFIMKQMMGSQLDKVKGKSRKNKTMHFFSCSYDVAHRCRLISLERT